MSTAGFVSELMTFEEQELGGKSGGVASGAPATNGERTNGDEPSHHRNGKYSHVAGGRRTAHVRESLPPAFQTQNSDSLVTTHFTGDHSALGDPGEEMEVKDSSGRYRHVRRAPVDERTLQPLRRVSKAGLESGDW